MKEFIRYLRALFRIGKAMRRLMFVDKIIEADVIVGRQSTLVKNPFEQTSHIIMDFEIGSEWAFRELLVKAQDEKLLEESEE